MSNAFAVLPSFFEMLVRGEVQDKTGYEVIDRSALFIYRLGKENFLSCLLLSPFLLTIRLLFL